MLQVLCGLVSHVIAMQETSSGGPQIPRIHGLQQSSRHTKHQSFIRGIRDRISWSLLFNSMGSGEEKSAMPLVPRRRIPEGLRIVLKISLLELVPWMVADVAGQAVGLLFHGIYFVCSASDEWITWSELTSEKNKWRVGFSKRKNQQDYTRNTKLPTSARWNVEFSSIKRVHQSACLLPLGECNKHRLVH